MGKTTGFLEYERKNEPYKPVEERIQKYEEFTIPLDKQELKKARSPLYGLWYSFLSQWLPAGQPDS